MSSKHNVQLKPCPFCGIFAKEYTKLKAKEGVNERDS